MTTPNSTKKPAAKPPNLAHARVCLNDVLSFLRDMGAELDELDLEGWQPSADAASARPEIVGRLRALRARATVDARAALEAIDEVAPAPDSVTPIRPELAQ